MRRDDGPKAGCRSTRRWILAPPGRDAAARREPVRPIRACISENPLGPSPGAVQAMARALAQAHCYPQPAALIARLAHLHRVERDWIVLGAGATELLRNVPRAFASDGTIVMAREAYRSVATAAGQLRIRCRLVPLDRDFRHDLPEMAAALDDDTCAVVICNPNNPTGTVLPARAIEDFAAALPKRVVCVVDEAYIDFVPGASVSARVTDVGNVLVLRSFSKAYGLAGARIGYGLGHPDLIRKLTACCLPYNVGTVGCAAASAALDDFEHVARTRAYARECREFYQQALAGCDAGYIPSETMSFLLETRQDGRLFAQRLQPLGIIVRPGCHWDLPRHVRISYAAMDDNRAIAAAIRRCLDQGR
jgi:histidinol-phosphate aminotransferase